VREAIATAGALPTLLAAIQERERRCLVIEQDLSALKALDQAGQVDEAELRKRLEEPGSRRRATASISRQPKVNVNIGAGDSLE